MNKIRTTIRLVADSTGMNVLASTARRLPEELQQMSAKGKAGFVAATALSLSRAAYELARGRHAALRQPSWHRTMLDVAAALTDTADGTVARKTGGSTAFGEALDPLMDKNPARYREVIESLQGTMSLVHPIVRTARDSVVTGYRAHVDRESDGHVSIAARSPRDFTSSKYSTLGYMVTNALLGSPVGRKLSPRARGVVATLSTAHVVFTGVKNIAEQRKALREYKRGHTITETASPAPRSAQAPQS
jgi:phosphatidylglycerophosphate synthase